MGNEAVTALIESLKELRTSDPPLVDERVGAYWWGEWDEEIAFALAMCATVSEEPVAKHLYLFSCAGDMAGREAVQQVVWWCAGSAAECAMTVNSRRRLRIPSYKAEWGRQAGNDGAALAMWGESIRDVLPGVNKRAQKYGCRDEAYLRVRDYVQAEASELIFRFKRDMEMAVTGRFDPDFRSRWEICTGRKWPRFQAE